jgi:hypothetical protein
VIIDMKPRCPTCHKAIRRWGCDDDVPNCIVAWCGKPSCPHVKLSAVLWTGERRRKAKTGAVSDG